MRRYKIVEEFGEKVQRFRKKQNLSQERLAEMVGVHRNHMGRIERGETNVSLVTVYRITQALKATSKDLLPF